MKKYLFIRGIIILGVFLSGFSLSCHKEKPTRQFPLASLHDIDESGLISAFADMSNVEGALSLIVCRHDVIVAEEYYYFEGYGPDSIKNIMSVTKTIIGLLTGIAIDEGFIENISDPVSKYLDHIISITEPVKASTTIEQLLSMTAGHNWNGTSSTSLFNDCFSSPDPLGYIINHPLVSTPGSVFNYSDGASHLLSVIISEATGQNTLDYLSEKLFSPMGISNFTWIKDNRSYPIGAAGLRIKPGDMVKIGQLILHKGMYKNQQLVPEEWIISMTSPQISTDNNVPYGPDYGYQVWIGNAGGFKHIMAMGWGGQFILIRPEQDLVVTASCWTSGYSWQEAGQHWNRILQVIAEKIFPAVH